MSSLNYNPSYNYQSATAHAEIVRKSQFDSLETLVHGTKNLGEIVLKNGEFVAVNNHAHLTILNGTVTTKQENLNVREAVFELLEHKFSSALTAWGKGDSPALDRVRERLLGAENRMMPISRKEVRAMIETLREAYNQRTEIEERKNHKITQAEFDRQMRSEANIADRALGTSLHFQSDTTNVAAYRGYSETRDNLARTLGSAGNALDENQANALADLAVSRSRLFKEDDVFNMLVSDFRKRFGEGDGDMSTRLFRELREKLKSDLAQFGADKLETLRQTLTRQEGRDYTAEDVQRLLYGGIAEYFDKLEAEFKSMQGVDVQDGRVVEMEALLDRKSTILKHAMLHLLTPDTNLVEEHGKKLSVDHAAIRMQESQRQTAALDSAIKDAGSALKEQHPRIAQELDDWTDNMRNLPVEEFQDKLDDINIVLQEAGVKAGRNIAEISLKTLKQLRQPEHLLEFKREYVRAFQELSAMGFSPEKIGKHLNKDLLLASGYSTAVRHALGKLRAERFDTGDDKIGNALAKATRELAEIRQMKESCTDFLKRIRSLMKEQIINKEDIDQADEMFHRKCAPLLKALNLKHADASVRQRLSLLLPDFIASLERRETEVGNQIDRLSGILDEAAENAARSIPPTDVGDRLVAELRAFAQGR